VRGHRLCQSTLIRAELGFEDPVPADAALARSVNWLVANPPDEELERQIADPFDYAAEDELVRRWREVRETLGDLDASLPEQGHQYRHPKKPGEAWTAGR
jgi:hypothetical protein